MNVPTAILDRIRAEPEGMAGWLALAAQLHDYGEYDLATAVRAHWPAVRECMRDQSPMTVAQAVEHFLSMARRDAARIARRAREAEERGTSDF